MKNKIIDQKDKILLLFIVIGITTAAQWVEKRCWWWNGSQWIEQTGLDTAAYCSKFLLVTNSSDSCNKKVWRIHFTDTLYFYPMTKTPGYWKTHPEAWPSGYNPNDRFFRSGKTWMGVLWTVPSGNDVYYPLAHHYIAAVLNRAAGRYVPLDVENIIESATKWFRKYRPPVRHNTPEGQQAIAWTQRLDVYNNTGI